MTYEDVINNGDAQFTTSIIESFKEEDSGYSLTFIEGLSFWMPGKEFIPEIGQSVRLYGKGFGYSVRGMIVGNNVVYYKTKEEHEDALSKQQSDRMEKIKKERDGNDSEYERRLSLLPKPFIDRVLGFRSRNESWKYEFESYELFVCEQAVEIANKLKDAHSLHIFKELDFKDQKELVPNLSSDHSGNTFGMSCVLAEMYLIDPELIPKMHGALCPLVGCGKYGCFSTTVTE